VSSTSDPGNSARTAPGVVPLLRLSPATVVLAIALADAITYPDSDLWGHVRFGQAILAAAHLVRTDPYSYSAAGHIWLDHEWLAEVAMAAAYKSLGVFGLKLLKLALTTLTFVFLSKAMGETGASAGIQIAVVLLCAVAISMQMEFRPQMFSFALLSILIFMLARDIYRRIEQLWLAIPLLLLWANLHGGFIVGLATLGVYTLVSGAQDLWSRRGVARGYKLGAISVAAALATIVTPYGIGIWQAVLHALANPLTRNLILDWQPFARALLNQWQLSRAWSVGYICALAIVAAFAYAIVLAPAANDLGLVAVAIVMTLAAAMSVRNVPMALLTIATPLTYHLALALNRRVACDEAAHIRVSGRHTQLWLIQQGVFCAAALTLLTASGMISKSLNSNGHYPAGAVRFMELHRLRGNVLDSFDWGEYLIWHLAPASRVFIDGRYDTVYPTRVLNEMIAFNFNQTEVAQVLGADASDYMLLPAKVPATRLIQARPDWKLAYCDEYFKLYLRPESRVRGKSNVRVVIDQLGAAQVLDAYPHDFVLLRADAPANQLMETRADWKIIYRDDSSRLYARAGSAAAHLPNLPSIGTSETTNFPW